MISSHKDNVYSFKHINYISSNDLLYLIYSEIFRQYLYDADVLQIRTNETLKNHLL